MPSSNSPATIARKRALRRTVTVKNGARILERAFRLPEGSVLLVLPGRQVPRSDQTIERLRERWLESVKPA